MQFKNINAGTFYMGSCKLSEASKETNDKLKSIGIAAIIPACPSDTELDYNASDNETPQHMVTITKDFQMSVYEVTVGQFKKFISEEKRDDLLTDKFRKDNSHGNMAAVTSVSWHDAQDFIHWLNKRENTKSYRLPTEAEWEYAARAGTNSIYSWGNNESDADLYAWHYKNTAQKRERFTHSVGEKAANPWGLHDMHGNAWEWTSDWYSNSYYQHSTKYDPNGRSSGRYRVNRGGSWYNNSKDRHLRSANRGFNLPNDRSSTIGFRLLRNL